MDVLKEIIASVRKNLPKTKDVYALDTAPNRIDFAKSLTEKKNSLSLIAEFKRKSPSKGNINLKMSIPNALRLYKPYASALSVLTEPAYFGGSLNDLKEARELEPDLPILRKDFIIDPIQVREANHYGATSYLLIVAALSFSQLKELIHAGEEFAMMPLIEVHNEEELELALEANVNILGINNRSLSDLSIDLTTTQRLIRKIPEDRKKELIIISESGFHSRRDLGKLPEGVDAVLIGTSFMQSASPEKLLSEMFG